MSACDPNQIVDYLSGRLSEEEMLRVEQHLGQCETCRQRLEEEAAPAAAWTKAKSLLVDDSFDGAATSVFVAATSIGDDFSFPDLVEETDEASGVTNAAMVTREISGWLDPTDDPSMLGRFAGYEIVGVVGHGEMGIVLKGFEPSLNRFVAIKAMAPRLASSEASRQRFAREARATAAVLHENVVAIHRVDQTHGLPFLVMPYLGGESLQRRIDQVGPLGIEASLQIATQVAAGLAAAHARGLIHRDIKPANILLPHGVERVTITDFGLARAADETSVTRTGIIAGTPPYMSPEQARGQQLDARSDLFSLGSVLYAMLTARLPFHGETNHEIIHRVATERAESLQATDASIPDWVSKLVDWLHEKSPSARPESAAEVQRVIDTCLSHLQDPSVPLPRFLFNPESVSRSRSVLQKLCLIIIPVAAICVALLLSKPWSGLGSATQSSAGANAEGELGVSANDEVIEDISAMGDSVEPVDIAQSDLSAKAFADEMLEIEQEILELERNQSGVDER